MNGDLNTLFFAGVVLVALTLIMRWVFTPSRSRRRVPVPGDAAPSLLEPILTRAPRAQGLALRATLGDAGIRSSLSNRRDGSVDVLVFRHDAERARSLLPPSL